MIVTFNLALLYITAGALDKDSVKARWYDLPTTALVLSFWPSMHRIYYLRSLSPCEFYDIEHWNALEGNKEVPGVHK